MERYRIGPEGRVYFITMTVVEWLPVFVSAEPCEILTRSLNHCHEHKGLLVNAYVIMPTHFHAIVSWAQFDSEVARATLIDFRKFTGRHLTDYCTSHMPKCFETTFARAAGQDRAHRFWQPTFRPQVIESEKFFVQKRDYLHDNPCRKGLVTRPEHWRFSSSSYWSADEPVSNDVILSALEL